MQDALDSKMCYVVGLGASAGGLEPLIDFFEVLPVDTGIAYVVVQHLSPDFKSMMDQLLGRHTSMPILKVDQELEIRPNHVYLITPETSLSIKNGNLVPKKRHRDFSTNLPIDSFFRSLADNFKQRAIGVILSGTGRDGTAGAQAIRQAGGYVVTQDPESCRFEGMPSSIIQEGFHNVVLPPNEMPASIIEHVLKNQSVLENMDGESLSKRIEPIFDLLKEVDGFDFRQYRATTTVRRIEKRMRSIGIVKYEQYLDLIRTSRKELESLHNDLLIGVTRFFRDEEAFESLRELAIKPLLQNSDKNEIRVWVAGCSTGEEAYSIAILFYEEASKLQVRKDIRIFATDIDRDAIAIASRGTFRPDTLPLSEERKSRFFTYNSITNTFKAQSYIRRQIVFSHHNVMRDPPFTKIDLVSCRNMLIYFQSNIQIKVLGFFYYSLNQGGYLFLGRSESLREFQSEITPLHGSHKIFCKVNNKQRRISGNFTVSKHSLNTFIEPHNTRKFERISSHHERPPEGNEGFYSQLLSQLAPSGILMDQDYSMIHVFNEANKFLKVPTGRQTSDVRQLLPNELSLALGIAVTRCRKTVAPVSLNNIYCSELHDHFLLELKPIFIDDLSEPTSFWISISHTKPQENENRQEETKEEYDLKRHLEKQIRFLEGELAISKENLHTTIEELETTNEELQSTNEELMSSNEELQSANEELHSVNEELYTVNFEYQSKIDQLTSVTKDIELLLNKTNIGIALLDQDLRVKRYSQSICDLINIVPHDIDRCILDLNFKYSHEEITDCIEQAKRTKTEQNTLITAEGRRYMVKVAAITSDDLDSSHSIQTGNSLSQEASYGAPANNFILTFTRMDLD